MEFVHPEIYDKYFNAEKKTKLMAKRMRMIQCMCEIVTINGRPFNYLLDSGFRQIIENDLKEFSNNGLSIPIDKNLTELHNYIKELANKVRKTITLKMTGDFIAIMLDAASKNNISVLGIAAQYLKDGKLNKHLLAMAHMEKAHTSEYMHDLVKKCLRQYNISADHVTAFTTDNASAMIRATKQFDEHVQDSYQPTDDVNLIDVDLPVYEDEHLSEFQMQSIMETISNIDEIRYMLDEADNFEELYEHFIGDISKASKTVFTIRCGAHLNQLAVRCGLKQSNVAHLLAICKFVVKKLRTEKIKTMAVAANLVYKMPSISCETRWDSDYDMVGLIAIFSFLCLISSSLIGLFLYIYIPFSYWTFFSAKAL